MHFSLALKKHNKPLKSDARKNARVLAAALYGMSDQPSLEFHAKFGPASHGCGHY
jgi:hypothetical protein